MPALDWVLLVVGTGLGILSLTADLIGLGEHVGFGWKQVVGTVVALALVTLGGLRVARRDRDRLP